VIVIYTDGVVEARRDGELYGLERLAQVVASSLELPCGGDRRRGDRRLPFVRRRPRRRLRTRRDQAVLNRGYHHPRFANRSRRQSF
jgi:Serine phosphatase RsbU, regulator of sigma subunit